MASKEIKSECGAPRDKIVLCKIRIPCIQPCTKPNVSGRAFWEALFNSESKLSHWEITKDIDNKTVRLLYVPNDNYSKDDIDIKVSFEVFKDLLDFMVMLSQPCR